MIITCIIISFIIGAILMLCVIILMSYQKDKKPQNKVHFYVARDINGELWLYLEKPVRDKDYKFFMANEHGCSMTPVNGFKYLGLNPDDFKNLKWEDEPIEVFLNLEDLV